MAPVITENNVTRSILAENRIYHEDSNKSKLWDFDQFKTQLKIDIISMDATDIEFDLVGVDCSLANAFRRILLAEVPTMAIEKVHIYNNTSVIKDEIMAHRLGLIPLQADASLFEYPESGDDGESTEYTLKFELKVKCTKRSNASTKSYNVDTEYEHSKVYTNAIRWIPLDDQAATLTEVKPIHDDILIAKLRPGQELHMVMLATKGIGKDHAKFSPVSTASYRLLPNITIKEKIVNDEARQLQGCFSPGVIELKRNHEGDHEAVVADVRSDTCNREVFNHPNLKDKVELSKISNHFIFSIESCTSKSADQLFIESVKVLMSKCSAILKELDESEQMP